MILKDPQINIFWKIFFCFVLIFLGLISASVTHATISTLPFNAGKLPSPIAITVDSSDNVYVSETGVVKLIQSFDSEGNVKYYKTSPPFWNNIYTDTSNGCIALDSLGNLYVTAPPLEKEGYHNFCNISVFKYATNGNLISNWENYPKSPFPIDWLTCYRPLGIAIDSKNHVYVADPYGLTVHMFGTIDGVNYKVGAQWEYIKIVGIMDKNKALKFYNDIYPPGIAVDPSGNIYVTDWYDNQIKKIGIDGKITSWGSEGSVDGQFKCPAGISLDSKGFVYVADRCNNRIQVFDNNGNFVLKFGKEGSKEGEFKKPTGIAVDSKGYVYVADTGNNRIQKFAIVQKTPFIIWDNPADIKYGTQLNSTQLNALAIVTTTDKPKPNSGLWFNWEAVQGTFIYTPPEGTVLSAGTHTLHVDFAPTDAENYTTVSKDVTINVKG